MNRPYVHCLLYGDPGVGKSTMASTFPKPMLVFTFDGYQKEMPYIKGGDDQGLKTYNIEVSETRTIEIVYRDVIHEDGLTRIEYYNITDDVERPTAFANFRTRMGLLQTEYDTWKTIVVDSVTFMELHARKLEQYILNPIPGGQSMYTKGVQFDTRTWFGGSTSALEEMLCIRFAGLVMNVVIICHIDKDKNMVSGEIVQVPFAPGRLSDRSLLSAGYAEQYRLYTIRDSEGRRAHQAQTTNRDGWVGGTQINAPDPVYPHYDELWLNWDKEYNK